MEIDTMKTITALTVVILLLAGCIPSLHPLFTPNDLEFEPAMLGGWQRASETWIFEKADENTFRLIHSDNSAKGTEFDAHLVKLGDQRYLDLKMTKYNKDEPETTSMGAASLIGAHLFMKVWQVTPTLRLSHLDNEWLEKYLAENPSSLRHELVELQPGVADTAGDTAVVLTASTKDLQAFVRIHQADLFPSDNIMDFARSAPVE